MFEKETDKSFNNFQVNYFYALLLGISPLFCLLILYRKMYLQNFFSVFEIDFTKVSFIMIKNLKFWITSEMEIAINNFVNLSIMIFTFFFLRRLSLWGYGHYHSQSSLELIPTFFVFIYFHMRNFPFFLV